MRRKILGVAEEVLSAPDRLVVQTFSPQMGISGSSSIYVYGPFADPIAALLHDTDFEPSSVSLASILIDVLRLLGIEAGDIMEMKARHEAYQRRRV